MRSLYLCLGYTSIALGAAGIVLPLLPTTPFLLLAAWCFARSNPQQAERLYAHPRFGAALRDWRDQRAISRRAKTYALGAMGVSYASGLWVMQGSASVLVMTVVMGPIAVYLATRPTPLT